MKEVIIRFLYKTEKDKDDDYYRNKAFDEIYNSDDVLDSSGFEVKDKKERDELHKEIRRLKKRIKEFEERADDDFQVPKL